MVAMLQGKHFEKPPDDKMQNAMKTLLDIASERTGVQGSHYKLDMRDVSRAKGRIQTSLGVKFKELDVRIQDYLLECRRRHNAAIPFHQLPNEILVRIMSFTVDKLGLAYLFRLCELRQVSKRWADVAESPSLYTTVASDYPQDSLQRALTKSKSSPLDVVLNGGGSYNVLDILHERHRWRSAELTYQPPVVLRVLKSAIMPNLEDLSIYSDPVPSTVEDLVIEGAPRLRHLSLHGGMLPSSVLRGLRSLRLQCIPHETAITISQLTEILRSSSDLDELSLESLSIIPILNSVVAEVQPIELSELTTFKAAEIAPEPLHNILRILRIPRCSRFFVKSSSSPDLEKDLLDPSMPHLISYIQEMLNITTTLEVKLTATSLAVSAYGGGKTFVVDLARQSRSAIQNWLNLIADLPTKPLREVRLVIWRSRETVVWRPILQILGGNRSITSLTITNGPPPHSFLVFLATPTVIDGTLQWPLPLLNVLGFVCCAPGAAQLIAAVRSRFGGGLGDGINVPKVSAAPLTLRILDPHELAAGDLSTLRDILGQDAVQTSRLK